MVWPPCFFLPLFPIFLVLCAVIIWQRPPNTVRGRLFRLGTSFTGILVSWLLLGTHIERIDMKTRQRLPLQDRWRGMFEEPFLLWTIVGLAVLAVSVVFFVKAVFGADPPDEGEAGR